VENLEHVHTFTIAVTAEVRGAVVVTAGLVKHVRIAKMMTRNIAVC